MCTIGQSCRVGSPSRFRAPGPTTGSQSRESPIRAPRPNGISDLLEKARRGALVGPSVPILESHGDAEVDNTPRSALRKLQLLGPPRLHTTAEELQTCTFQGPALQKTTKSPRKDPHESGERKRIVAGEGKKREILGLPPFGGPAPPFGAPPFGAPLFLGLGSPHIGQIRMVKNGLAKVGLSPSQGRKGAAGGRPGRERLLGEGRPKQPQHNNTTTQHNTGLATIGRPNGLAQNWIGQSRPQPNCM